MSVVIEPYNEDVDNLISADQAIKDFIKSHKNPLSGAEHEKLGEILKNRANALSGLLGKKVNSVAD